MYIVLTVVLFISRGSSAADSSIDDITNGLDLLGDNVCSYTDEVSRQVQVSFAQHTVTTKWKEVCCWEVIGCWKWCNKTTLATKSFVQYRTTTKYYDRKTYHCCTGWDRTNESATSCQKPVCSIECRNGGVCSSPDVCTCASGFKGKFCQIDIDECRKKGTNDCEQICVNTNGGYKCACKNGYKLNDDNKTCTDIDECSNSTPPCQCQNKDTECGSKCTNLAGSYKCECGKGFRLSGAQECEDINECVETPDVCQQSCVNTPGSYYCKCEDGYIHNGKTCVDIDECATNIGGCSDSCHNINGTHVCSCPDRFYLSDDKRTCKLINSTTLKKVTVCESDIYGYLECTDTSKTLAILDVVYGRLTDQVCQVNDYKSNLRCISINGFQHLKACNGLSTCMFYFDLNRLGDPCPGVEKYLEVTYDCI